MPATVSSNSTNGNGAPSINEPSTHQQINVGGEPVLSKYHTETAPYKRNISVTEVALYESDPPSLVGKKFVPTHGEDLWEVVEVTFDKNGWNTATLGFEGRQDQHRMELDGLMSMMKSGTLKVVEME